MLKSALSLALLSIGGFLQASLLITDDQPNKQGCKPSARSMRIAARHIEAGGIGYNKGYSTLEGFFAADPNRCWAMPFLDLRWHVFNDERMAANAGLGVRGIGGCRVYGANFYYDYRNTNKRSYNQVGMGLETLGKVWDFRINGYLPVGGKASHSSHVEFAKFSGNSILVNRKFQFAMKGVDAEVGFHFGKSSLFDFYGAAGPYYFKGKIGDGAFGGKVRLAGSYKEYITLEVMDSFDNVFHNNVQGQLTLSVPFGSRSKPKLTRKNCPDTCEFAAALTKRMVQPVNRQEIVVVDTHKKTSKTSDFIIFVNNMSSSDGTFESPYPTLLQAQNNSGPEDIIYVFSGDGTTNGYSHGIVLQNNQKFWGSGVGHTLNTNLGTIFIPPYTANSPHMTNTGGKGITLAMNNEVSGFVITQTSMQGIDGVNPGALSILSSTISNSNSGGAYGIHIHTTGSSTNSILINEVAVLSNGDGAVFIETNDNSNTTVLAQNSRFDGGGETVQVEPSGNSVLNMTLNNNFIVNGSEGILANAGGAQFSANIKNCTFSGTSVPVDIEPFTLSSVTLSNNTFTNNDTGALFFFGATIATPPSTLFMENNTFQNNGSFACEITQDGAGSTLCLTLTGNTADNHYQLTKTAGTFKVTPCDPSSVNTGTIDYSPGIMSFGFVKSCPSGANCP